jgi:hypothetical protein
MRRSAAGASGPELENPGEGGTFTGVRRFEAALAHIPRGRKNVSSSTNSREFSTIFKVFEVKVVVLRACGSTGGRAGR